MMSHRHKEGDDYRNSSCHNRQHIQHTTVLRTQQIPSSSKHSMDRHSTTIAQSRSGVSGKLLDFFYN